jgi:hypothetical protein
MKAHSVDDISKEIFELLSDVKKTEKFEFVFTEKDNKNKLFKHGCDFVVKYFDNHFKESFETAKENEKVAVKN